MKIETININNNINTYKATEDTQYILQMDTSNNKYKSINEISLDFVLEKEDLNLQIIGPMIIREKQNIKISIQVKHMVPNTSCEVLIKSVIFPHSSLDFLGRIYIDNHSRNTTASLKDNSLLLGEGSRKYSKPVLEIHNNEVKAFHGSASGNIDPLSLYYLQSRGLNKSQSENILIEGFLDDLINRINDSGIRDKLIKELKFQEKEPII